MLRGLLHAVREAPEDDLPRLVLADWLEENDDPERAEFVRVQCTLARPDAGPDRTQLQRRESDLLEKHSGRWVGDLRYYDSAWRWQRGLLHVVLAALSPPRSDLTSLPAWVWVDDLRLVHCPGPQVIDLLSSPALAGINGLHLRGSRGTDEAGLDGLLRALVTSPHATQVSSLTLSGPPDRDPVLEILAGWPGLARLTRLRCTPGYSLTAVGVRWLTSSSWTPRLTELELPGLGDAAVEALAGWAGLAGLRILKLRQGQIGPAGARALAESPHLAGLEVLDLSDNDLGVAGADALARSPYLGGLRELHVSPWGAGEAGLAALRVRFGDAVRSRRRLT